MKKILFVCHGNICRSTMAEALCKYMLDSQNMGEKYHIESAGTSREELGNKPDKRTVNLLFEKGINSEKYLKDKRARQVVKKEYEDWDYFICMDENNVRNINRIFDDKEHKVFKMMQFAGQDRDVKDPWYTGNFETTYEDLKQSIPKMIEYVEKK